MGRASRCTLRRGPEAAQLVFIPMFEVEGALLRELDSPVTSAALDLVRAENLAHIVLEKLIFPKEGCRFHALRATFRPRGRALGCSIHWRRGESRGEGEASERGGRWRKARDAYKAVRGVFDDGKKQGRFERAYKIRVSATDLLQRHCAHSGIIRAPTGPQGSGWRSSRSERGGKGEKVSPQQADLVVVCNVQSMDGGRHECPRGTRARKGERTRGTRRSGTPPVVWGRHFKGAAFAHVAAGCSRPRFADLPRNLIWSSGRADIQPTLWKLRLETQILL